MFLIIYESDHNPYFKNTRVEYQSQNVSHVIAIHMMNYPYHKVILSKISLFTQQTFPQHLVCTRNHSKHLTNTNYLILILISCCKSHDCPISQLRKQKHKEKNNLPKVTQLTVGHGAKTQLRQSSSIVHSLKSVTALPEKIHYPLISCRVKVKVPTLPNQVLSISGLPQMDKQSPTTGSLSCPFT